MGKSKYLNPPSEAQKRSFAKYLSEDEELVIATGYGPTYLRQRFIIHLMLPGAIFILLGLALSYFYKERLGDNFLAYGLGGGFILAVITSYIQTWIAYNAHRYLLTTRRVIIKIGFFNVKLISALFDKITHIEVDQGFYDRLVMHHGRIFIHTAGMSKDELILEFIDAPIEFKNVLERLINRQRERVGRSSYGTVTTIEGEIVDG